MVNSDRTYIQCGAVGGYHEMQWSSYNNGRIRNEYNMQNTSFIDEIIAVMVKDEMVKFSGTSQQLTPNTHPYAEIRFG